MLAQAGKINQQGKSKNLTRNSQKTESRELKNSGTTLEQLEEVSFKAKDEIKRN